MLLMGLETVNQTCCILFFLSDSPASEFHVPTFRDTVFIGSVSRKNSPNNLIPVIRLAYTTYKDGKECSETSEHDIQKPGNHPKERIQLLEHGESLKSSMNQIS